MNGNKVVVTWVVCTRQSVVREQWVPSWLEIRKLLMEHPTHTATNNPCHDGNNPFACEALNKKNSKATLFCDLQ